MFVSDKKWWDRVWLNHESNEYLLPKCIHVMSWFKMFAKHSRQFNPQSCLSMRTSINQCSSNEETIHECSSRWKIKYRSEDKNDKVERLKVTKQSDSKSKTSLERVCELKINWVNN